MTGLLDWYKQLKKINCKWAQNIISVHISKTPNFILTYLLLQKTNKQQTSGSSTLVMHIIHQTYSLFFLIQSKAALNFNVTILDNENGHIRVSKQPILAQFHTDGQLQRVSLTLFGNLTNRYVGIIMFWDFDISVKLH